MSIFKYCVTQPLVIYMAKQPNLDIFVDLDPKKTCLPKSFFVVLGTYNFAPNSSTHDFLKILIFRTNWFEKMLCLLKKYLHNCKM